MHYLLCQKEKKMRGIEMNEQEMKQAHVEAESVPDSAYARRMWAYAEKLGLAKDSDENEEERNHDELR